MAGDPVAQRRPRRIHIVVFDGVDELDVVGPYEVLCNAAASAGWVVELASHAAPAEHLGAHGLPFRAGVALGSGEPELVVVPGGGWTSGAAVGARAEAARGEVPRRLAALHAGGAIMTAVCTGTMLLAAAGLLRGRRAVTHRRAIDDLGGCGAVVVDARVVDDGDIVTCGGVTSGIDLALWLVERFAGLPLATSIAERIQHERRGPIARPEE